MTMMTMTTTTCL